MNTDKNQHQNEQPQTAENTSTERVSNPFENQRPAEQDVQQAQEELEKEQQFKEAQTERD